MLIVKESKSVRFVWVLIVKESKSVRQIRSRLLCSKQLLVLLYKGSIALRFQSSPSFFLLKTFKQQLQDSTAANRSANACNNGTVNKDPAISALC